MKRWIEKYKLTPIGDKLVHRLGIAFAIHYPINPLEIRQRLRTLRKEVDEHITQMEKDLLEMELGNES